MKSLEFYCQLWKYLHFMISIFLMALFRAAVPRDLSVMRLHLADIHSLCSSSVQRDVQWSCGFGGCRGCACVCLSAFTMPAVTCL